MSRARTPTSSIASLAATAGVVVAYAADRGTYDLVARQEAGVVIWFALLMLAALGLLPAGRPARAVVVTVLALAGLTLWAAVSLSWSESDERTLAEVARALHHLGLLLLVIALAGRERWTSVVGGATAGAAVVSLWALGTRLAPGLFGTDTTAHVFATNRLSSPLGYWNAVGAWTAMTATLLLAWSGHARNTLVRALALAVVPAVLVALYLTYSRAGLVSVMLGAAVVVAFAARRWTTALHVGAAALFGGVAVLVTRGEPQIAGFTGTAGASGVALVLVLCGIGAGLVVVAAQRLRLDDVRLEPRAARRAAITGAAVTAVVLLVAGVTAGPHAWHQFSHAPLVASTSTDPAARLTNLSGGRFQIYASAVESFRREPLKGSGAGTLEFTWGRDGRTAEFVRDAHSLYLEAFTELGLIGGLLVLLLAGGLVAIVVTARSRAGADAAACGAAAGCAGAGAAYLFAAGVDWMWEVTAVSALMFVLAGAAGASTLRGERRPGIGARVGLVAAALVAIVVLLPGMRSARDVRSSERAVARGDLPAAARAARAAEKSAPWAATPHVQLALVAERAGDLPAAEAQLRAAARREPTNWRIPFLLSRVEAAAGDGRQALRSYRRARTLRPLGVFFTDPAAVATPPER